MNYRNSRYSSSGLFGGMPQGMQGAQGSPFGQGMFGAMMRPNPGPNGASMMRAGGNMASPFMSPESGNMASMPMKGSGDTGGIMGPMSGGSMAMEGGPGPGMRGMSGGPSSYGDPYSNFRRTMGPSSLGQPQGDPYSSFSGMSSIPGMGGPARTAPPGPMTGSGGTFSDGPLSGAPDSQQSGSLGGGMPQSAPQGPPQGINYSQLYANANNNAFRGDTAPMGGPPDQSKGVVLAEGAQGMSGFVPPGGAFPEPTTPTYMNGMTALLYGGPNGPKAPPPDPRMVWGMGNAGGKPGYQLVNGYNGYKG